MKHEYIDATSTKQLVSTSTILCEILLVITVTPLAPENLCVQIID